MRTRRSALLDAPAAAGEQNVDSRRFNGRAEFPNLLLPREHRDKAPQDVPQEVVDLIQGKIDAVLGSWFSRAELAIWDQQIKGFKKVRYFVEADRLAKSIDPAARVLPSAGVVRAAIGRIYQRLNRSWETDRERFDPVTLLDAMAAEKGAIAMADIRGSGSDLDVLVDGTENPKVNEAITKMTNSSETSSGLRDSKAAFKRMIFSIGDTHFYDEQIGRATAQGGLTLDFIAYELEAQKMRTPEKFPNMISDMIRGLVEYVAPESEAAIEDLPKQTARGLRFLIELPWLVYRDETRLRKELATLIADLEAGKRPSFKTYEQLFKMERNQWSSGAHNRLYRAAAGSIDELAAKLNELMKKTTTNDSFVHEFVDVTPLSGRVAGPPPGWPAEMPLMPSEEFVRTRGETLYHATTTQAAFSILRGGMYVSSETQGRAAWGRGGYTGITEKEAKEGAGGGGERAQIVLPLAVVKDERLRILVWDEKYRELPFIKDLAQRDPDVFRALAREHGIDIIVNHYVLVQNTAALVFPSRVASIVERAGSAIVTQPAEAENNSIESLRKISRTVEEYNGLLNVLEANGEAVQDARDGVNRVYQDRLEQLFSSEEALQRMETEYGKRKYGWERFQDPIDRRIMSVFDGLRSLKGDLPTEVIGRIWTSPMMAPLKAKFGAHLAGPDGGRISENVSTLSSIARVFEDTYDPDIYRWSLDSISKYWSQSPFESQKYIERFVMEGKEVLSAFLITQLENPSFYQGFKKSMALLIRNSVSIDPNLRAKIAERIASPNGWSNDQFASFAEVWLPSILSCCRLDPIMQGAARAKLDLMLNPPPGQQPPRYSEAEKQFVGAVLLAGGDMRAEVIEAAMTAYHTYGVTDRTPLLSQLGAFGGSLPELSAWIVEGLSEGNRGTARWKTARELLEMVAPRDGRVALAYMAFVDSFYKDQPGRSLDIFKSMSLRYHEYGGDKVTFTPDEVARLEAYSRSDLKSLADFAKLLLDKKQIVESKPPLPKVNTIVVSGAAQGGPRERSSWAKLKAALINCFVRGRPATGN